MASKHHSDSCCCEFVPFSTVKSTLGSVSLCLESFLFRFSTLVVYFPPNSPSQRSFHPTSISNHPSTHPEQVRITLVHFQLVHHPYTRQSQWLLCMHLHMVLSLATTFFQRPHCLTGATHNWFPKFTSQTGSFSFSSHVSNSSVGGFNITLTQFSTLHRGSHGRFARKTASVPFLLNTTVTSTKLMPSVQPILTVGRSVGRSVGPWLRPYIKHPHPVSVLFSYGQ